MRQDCRSHRGCRSFFVRKSGFWRRAGLLSGRFRAVRVFKEEPESFPAVLPGETAGLPESETHKKPYGWGVVLVRGSFDKVKTEDAKTVVHDGPADFRGIAAAAESGPDEIAEG